MRIVYRLTANTPEDLRDALRMAVEKKIVDAKAQLEGHTTQKGEATAKGQLYALEWMEYLLTNLEIERE